MGERVDLWEAAASNRRNSILLIIVVMALALALGFAFMMILFPDSPIWAGPLVSGGIHSASNSHWGKSDSRRSILM